MPPQTRSKGSASDTDPLGDQSAREGASTTTPDITGPSANNPAGGGEPPRVEEEAGSRAGSKGGHVVLTDGLTYAVPGRKKTDLPSSLRARKGWAIELDPELNDIDRLIALKAIAVNDGESKRRTTAKALCQAAGGIDDPVTVPENLFDVTRDDITGDEDNGDEAPDTSTPADDE